jgi:hypothetical protein
MSHEHSTKVALHNLPWGQAQEPLTIKSIEGIKQSPQAPQRSFNHQVI